MPARMNLVAVWPSHLKPMAVPAGADQGSGRVEDKMGGRELPSEQDTYQADGGLCQDERRR